MAPLRRAALLPALLLAAAPLAPALAQDECPGSITVQGEGAVTAIPDLLRLTFRAEAQAPTPAAALAEASARTGRMIEALRAEGVAETDIATVEVSLYPVQDRPERDQPIRTIGWQAAGGVSAAVRDLDAFGAIAERATDAGATGLSGIAFEVSDAAVRLGEARAAAVRDALARADAMAAAAGMSRGMVLEISEGGAPAPRGFETRSFAMADASAQMPAAPGERSLTATVSLTAALCR